MFQVGLRLCDHLKTPHVVKTLSQPPSNNLDLWPRWVLDYPTKNTEKTAEKE